jgi:hypothetical protein
MKRCLVLVLLLIAMPAEANFRTASEWVGLPPLSRAFYVAGVRDFTAMMASRGSGPVLSRIHTCLGAARFVPAETADFIFEWIKLRKDVAESNAAGVVLSYIENDCRSASADYAKPAKAELTYKGFVALTPPLQASYVEAIQDTLAAVSHRRDNWARQLRECMIRGGLMDAKRLANAVTEYAKLNGSGIEADASFAHVTVFFLLERCK